jgi:hypothetical protein
VVILVSGGSVNTMFTYEKTAADNILPAMAMAFGTGMPFPERSLRNFGSGIFVSDVIAVRLVTSHSFGHHDHHNRISVAQRWNSEKATRKQRRTNRTRRGYSSDGKYRIRYKASAADPYTSTHTCSFDIKGVASLACTYFRRWMLTCDCRNPFFQTVHDVCFASPQKQYDTLTVIYSN